MVMRAAIVAEARAWIGTPFHHQARLKGVGVDCANLLVGVYSAVGAVPAISLDHYPPDWHLHQDTPRFMAYLLQYAEPIPASEQPQPGDIAMFRYGRQAAHGAIVSAWPLVIHAWLDVGRVVETEADRGPLAARFVGCYRVHGVTS